MAWLARLRRAIVLPIAIAATTATLTNCAWAQAADDVGHATFAREGIKLLLGRPARGVDEVEAVADIARLLGRDVAARMLMTETEFVDTWAEVLVDLLQVQQEGGNQLAGQDKACWGAPTLAWAGSEPTIIARWVRDHGPQESGGPTTNAGAMAEWNMTDLLRSAIALDDLSPVVRAYLFPLSMRRADYVDYQDPLAREQLVTRFLKVYLNRDTTCLGCHNPIFSASNKSDATGAWQRTWSIPGHAEKALFPDYPSGIARNSLHDIMRGDVRWRDWPGNPPTFGIQPWGMAKDCARDTADDLPSNNPVPPANSSRPSGYTFRGFRYPPGQPPPPPSGPFVLPDTTESNPNTLFGSIKGSNNDLASLWELEAALRSGIAGLTDGYDRLPAGPAPSTTALEKYCAADLVFTAKCQGCHNSVVSAGGLNLSAPDRGSQLVNRTPTSPSSLHTNSRVEPGCLLANTPNATNSNITCSKGSELWLRVDTSSFNVPTDPSDPPLPGYIMPQDSYLDPADQNAIKEWINSGAPHTAGCNTSALPDVDPDEALAYLTAANLVDGIWMAAMGHRLTIDHGYSRNQEQRDMLWDLTENVFLTNSWSLKDVLTKILASDWYARRAPAIADSPTSGMIGPYNMSPILDPWVVTDPRVTNPAPSQHQKYNGQGEEVDRFRVNTLLRHVAASLGWKKPDRFPDTSPNSAYPSALALNLGQYLSPQNRGFTGVNFQSLLALESETGACDNNLVSNPGNPRSIGATDWIDVLVQAIGAFNTANPNMPVRLAEAWMILKDRLIQDPRINASPVGDLTPPSIEAVALLEFLQVELGAGVGLSTSTATLSTTALTTALRHGCGVLVKSPYFVLTNIMPPSYYPGHMPGPTRLDVCLPDEKCGYAQICDYWRLRLASMSYGIACQNRSVVSVPVIHFAGHELTAVSSGFNWGVLTRQVADWPAQGRMAPEAAPRTVRQFDLIAGVRVDSREPLRGLSRVSQRLATMCPGSLCGFVKSPASSIARCAENPRDNSCVALFPNCNPRTRLGPNGCGALPADYRDSGLLAVWAEGAEVRGADKAHLLRSGAQSWQPLQAGVKLAAGDIIHLPLAGSLRLQVGNVAFGDTSMAETRVAGLTGHLLAITGASAEKLPEPRPVRGALSRAELMRGVRSGAFESRAMTPADWKRARASIALRETRPPLTPAQIRQMSSNYEILHRGIPKERPK